MERRLPVVENEGYDVVLSEHIADLLGWEREDILKKIDALIREYDLDSQFDSRGTHVVYFFEDTVADYEENVPLEDHVFRRVFWVTALGCEQIAKGLAGDAAEAFTDCYTKSFAEYAASLSTQDTLAEGFSAFLGKTEFSEPAYRTDADGATLRKLSEMHYRRHGREHCFSELLDGNQKLVYALDGALLDRYALLAEAIFLEPTLARECLEHVQELYFQKDDPVFDALFTFVQYVLDRNPVHPFLAKNA